VSEEEEEDEMKKTVKTDFAIDDLKAIRIAGRLFEQFYNRKGIFKDYSMPEYVLPRNLKERSREHALFLTYVISIDYMTDAEKLWKKSRGAYELYSERFTPEKILKVSPRTVETFVRQLGARFGSNAASIWIKLSKVLTDKYDGDPRNITPEVLSIQEIKKKLNEFPSLRGPKLSNFYIRAMGETGLLKVKNLDELDIPVDKQVARFTIYTGVLKLLSEQFVGCAQDEPLRSLIEEAWRHAAKALSTAPWKIDEPIWTVGSKLCSERRCRQCPVEDVCEKTKGVTFKENTVVWTRKDLSHEDYRLTSKYAAQKPAKKSSGIERFVVFEDLEDATGPKVHSTNCFYYQRWLEKQVTTTKWHGPYNTEKEAWETCKTLALNTRFEPSRHKCVKHP